MANVSQFRIRLYLNKNPADAGLLSVRADISISIYLFWMCANVPSIFDCINARADAIKAQRWQTYIPLSQRQLKDKSDNLDTVTLDAGVFGQFVVLKRPTEMAGLHPDKHRNTVVIRHSTTELRWCVFCRCRHPFVDFRYNPKHYLHGYSYACKRSINERRAARWHYLGQTA